MTKRCGIAAMGGRGTPTNLRWMPCTLAPGHRGCCAHDPAIHAADEREARTWTRAEVLAFARRVRSECETWAGEGGPNDDDLAVMLDGPTS